MLTSKTLGHTLLFLKSISAFSLRPPAEVKGTYDADCDYYTFRLPPPRTTTSKGELTLRLQWRGGLYPPAFESAGWIDVKAKRCSSKAGECEDAAKAQIRFEQIGKRIIGGFKVEFVNEREAGKFDVNYHHKGPKVICE
jgi:hypothetical protein